MCDVIDVTVDRLPCCRVFVRADSCVCAWHCVLTRLCCVTSHRCLQLNREKTELLGQLDDNDESAAETMRKYTALVKQVR